MTGSSNKSIYDGHTPSKEPHRFTALPDPDQGAMAARRIDEFMVTKNGGGDPITALALRPSNPKTIKAARKNEVKRALTENLEKLSGSSA
ncbi:hypothetical protein DL768_002968 [Monosporascus sp. mg162]|nr:hypothetical protein DL768_002968 [Monosporascus sp. mg162]